MCYLLVSMAYTKSSYKWKYKMSEIFEIKFDECATPLLFLGFMTNLRCEFFPEPVEIVVLPQTKL